MFMNQQLCPIFDATVLPAALESRDPELLVSFYEMYIGHTREACQCILDAEPPYDYQKLQRSAHSLKSSSRSVGALMAGEMLRALEVAAEGKCMDQTVACVETARRVMTDTISVMSQEIERLKSSGDAC